MELVIGIIGIIGIVIVIDIIMIDMPPIEERGRSTVKKKKTETNLTMNRGEKLKRVEGKPERKNIDLENHPKCPECGSSNTELIYVNCRCCRTYEGNGRTCWTAPHCKDCDFVGAGNSTGGLWYMPDGW